MSDDFEKAILFSFDQTGSVAAGLKAQAQTLLQGVKASPGAVQLCLERFEGSPYVEVKFWCLQALHDAVRGEGYAALPPPARAAVKASLLAAGGSACGGGGGGGGPPLPPFLRNKLAQAIVAVAGHEYPDAWPSFFHDLLGTLGQGPPAVDLFCR